MLISMVLTIIILLIWVATRCNTNGSSNTSQTVEKVTSAPTSVYSEKVQRAIDDIKAGKYASVMSSLQPTDEKSIEYNLREFASALYNLSEIKNIKYREQADICIRVSKMSIGHIDDRYTGPFEDEIRKLKQYSDFNKKYSPEIGM